MLIEPAALPSGGRLLIHDVYLNDALDGPLPIALHSAALFTLTEGRAYSQAEYRAWLVAAGLSPEDAIAEVRRVRPHSIETRGQEDAVRRFAERGA